MKHFKSLVFLFICAVAFSLSANADKGGNGNGHAYGHDKPKEGKKVPIDGGITLLLAAGAALGVKSVLNKNKKKDAGSEV